MKSKILNFYSDNVFDIEVIKDELILEVNLFQTKIKVSFISIKGNRNIFDSNLNLFLPKYLDWRKEIDLLVDKINCYIDERMQFCEKIVKENTFLIKTNLCTTQPSIAIMVQKFLPLATRSKLLSINKKYIKLNVDKTCTFKKDSNTRFFLFILFYMELVNRIESSTYSLMNNDFRIETVDFNLSSLCLKFSYHLNFNDENFLSDENLTLFSNWIYNFINRNELLKLTLHVTIHEDDNHVFIRRDFCPKNLLTFITSVVNLYINNENEDKIIPIMINLYTSKK